MAMYVSNVLFQSAACTSSSSGAKRGPLNSAVAAFQRSIAGLGFAGAVLYGLVYVVAAILFVPGVLLTLGAGVAFGLGWGTALVSVASNLMSQVCVLSSFHSPLLPAERSFT